MELPPRDLTIDEEAQLEEEAPLGEQPATDDNQEEEEEEQEEDAEASPFPFSTSLLLLLLLMAMPLLFDNKQNGGFVWGKSRGDALVLLLLRLLPFPMFFFIIFLLPLFSRTLRALLLFNNSWLFIHRLSETTNNHLYVLTIKTPQQARLSL